MKSSIVKLAALSSLAVGSLIFISFRSSDHQETPEQILILETYLMATNEAGPYIFHPDKPTEWHDLKLLSKKNIETNGRLITTKLQELYNAGWKLEAVVGGDQYQRYILTKR